MAGDIEKVAVVDASVVLAVLLAEPAGDKFVKQLEDIKMAGGVLFAPSLLLYEIINGVKSNILRRRIGGGESSELWRKFLQLGVKLVDQEEFGQEILELAIVGNLTGYDAAYVILARKMGCRLLSLDAKLQKLAEKK